MNHSNSPTDTQPRVVKLQVNYSYLGLTIVTAFAVADGNIVLSFF
jgi:hypothetical protein